MASSQPSNYVHLEAAAEWFAVLADKPVSVFMSRPVKLLSVSIALICLLLGLNCGLRSSMGFFMAPISQEFGYGR